MEKRVIKVAVFSDRIFKLEPDIPLTVDHDIPSSYGTATTTFKIKFSERLGADEKRAYRVLSPVIGRAEKVMYEVSPGGPWVETSNHENYYEKEKTHQAVEILSNELPQYEFVVPESPYDLALLSRKNVRLNVGMGNDSLQITVDQKLSSENLKQMAKILYDVGYHPQMWSSEDPEKDVEAWCKKVNNSLAQALTKKLKDVAFVADASPQCHELVYDTYFPFILRLFGKWNEKPRIKMRKRN